MPSIVDVILLSGLKGATIKATIILELINLQLAWTCCKQLERAFAVEQFNKTTKVTHWE